MNQRPPTPITTAATTIKGSRDQKLVLIKAVAIKSEPRKGGNDVVIPEQPAVQNKNCRKQVRVGDDKPAGNEGRAENSKNVGGIKRKPHAASPSAGH